LFKLTEKMSLVKTSYVVVVLNLVM
jgi:hypothetical protein